MKYEQVPLAPRAVRWGPQAEKKDCNLAFVTVTSLLDPAQGQRVNQPHWPGSSPSTRLSSRPAVPVIPALAWGSQRSSEASACPTLQRSLQLPLSRTPQGTPGRPSAESSGLQDFYRSSFIIRCQRHGLMAGSQPGSRRSLGHITTMPHLEGP